MKSATSGWRYFGRYWPYVVIAFVAMLSAVGTGLALPYYLGRAVEALVAPDPKTHVPPLAMIMIALALAQAITRISGTVMLSWIARRAEHDLRCDLFAHLLALDPGFHRSQRTGDIVSRLTSDMQAVVTMWSMGVIWAIGATLLSVFAIVVMVTIHPTLSLWALLALPPVMLASHRIGLAVNRLSGQAQAHLGKLSASVQEDLTGMNVVRSYQLEQQRTMHFGELSRDLVRVRMRQQLAAGVFQPLMGAFGAISVLAVLWIGGRATIEGQMSLGALIQFNAYLALLSMRVVGLGDVISMFQKGAASWARLASILSRKPAICDGPGPGLAAATPRGDIELRDLTIEYDGHKLLDGVSLRIPAGTTCAIVGRVGSGKSTLVEAIPRLVDVPKGSVFVHGRDVTELPIADLRRTIAYASQSAFLFSATIAQNIAFGIDDASSSSTADRIQRAAEAAGLGPDLAILPRGLETHVGERGITLSGGQRQRVTLARVLANERPIVILDDSLSSVDAETERRILGNLDRALGGRTVVLISHRVSAVKRAHQIVVLDHGRIAEVGDHDALLARGGIYAELYRAQIEEEQGTRGDASPGSGSREPGT